MNSHVKPLEPRTEAFTWILVFFSSSSATSFSPYKEKYNFLGISIVGQSNERGDGGIYIGSIMKGGAVAADGRIEPGDMLLQVCVCACVYVCVCMRVYACVSEMGR